MKYLFLLLSIILISTACNSDSPIDQSSPEETTKGFVAAINAHDFKKVQQYCTAKAAKSWLDFATNIKMSNAEEKEELLNSLRVDVSEINCTNTDGTTICKVCCGAENTEGEWELIEKNSKWFVQTEIGI